VSAGNCAAAQFHLAAGNTVRLQDVETYRRTHDIDDGVHGPYFVEGDVFGRDPVYLGFGPGDQGKNSQSPLFCPGAYSGILYQFPDIFP
jgi:hypothetical protein